MIGRRNENYDLIIHIYEKITSRYQFLFLK